MTVFLSATSSTHALMQRKFTRTSLLPLSQDYLWQIEVGVVRSFTLMEDGTSITLGLWGAGDVVGRPLSKADPYQIECLTDVQVTLLPASRWYQATDAFILHTQRLGEFLEIVHCKPIEVSLLRLFNWLAERFGREIDQGKLIELRLTHQEIAEIIGSSRVTITRTINDFEQQGIIQRLGRKLVILQEQPFWHYDI